MNEIKEIDGTPNEEIYKDIYAYLKTLGDVDAMPHKTQISFGGGGSGFKTNFAFVWLNGKTLTLTFDLTRHVVEPPVIRSMFVRKNRWVHHVELKSKADFTPKVKELLKESFEFGKLGLRDWKEKNKQ